MAHGDETPLPWDPFGMAHGVGTPPEWHIRMRPPPPRDPFGMVLGVGTPPHGTPLWDPPRMAHKDGTPPPWDPFGMALVFGPPPLPMLPPPPFRIPAPTRAGDESIPKSPAAHPDSFLRPQLRHLHLLLPPPGGPEGFGSPPPSVQPLLQPRHQHGLRGGGRGGGGGGSQCVRFATGGRALWGGGEVGRGLTWPCLQCCWNSA